jgi:DNA invertase Pin-like site-specific DNA recombinase
MYVLSKFFQELCADGVITPDGRAVDRSDRTPKVVQPFKLDQRLTEEIRAKIISRYESGASSLRLANQFRISKGSVIRILRDAGVPIRSQRLSDEQIEEAASLYRSGLSLIQIGIRLGSDATTVHRQLRRYGVQMRDTHGRDR